MFKKTRQSRLYQDVVEQIQGAILAGRLKAGDRLPSQREMVDMFEISRATLREALRVLEQKGLIDIKLGTSGGAIVKEINTAPVSESLALLIRHQKVSLDEIIEFRKGVEGNVAELAAIRATEKDLSQIRQLLDVSKKQMKKGLAFQDAFEASDRRIHKYIAQIAGNTIYRTVIRMIHDNIHQYYEKLPFHSEAELYENYRDLEGIVDAISRGAAGDAKAAAQSHIGRFHRFTQQNFIN